MGNASCHPRTLRDAIRRRPGMYIGGTDLWAVHHLLSDILAAIVLRYRRVWMNIQYDHHLSIRMVGDREQQQQDTETAQSPEIIAMMSVLESSNITIGHDFDRDNILLATLSALSIDFMVEAPGDGFLWIQSIREGLLQGEALNLRDMAVDETEETVITFKLDPSIFGGIEPEVPRLKRQCNELASLNPEVEITFCDERDGAA